MPPPSSGEQSTMTAGEEWEENVMTGKTTADEHAPWHTERRWAIHKDGTRHYKRAAVPRDGRNAGAGLVRSLSGTVISGNHRQTCHANSESRPRLPDRAASRFAFRRQNPQRRTVRPSSRRLLARTLETRTKGDAAMPIPEGRADSAIVYGHAFGRGVALVIVT